MTTRSAATTAARPLGRNVMRIWCCGCGCDVDARLTDGGEIYPHRADLRNLPFWKCDTCGNFVGCHHKTKNRTAPLGCIPTPELKEARKHLHALIDPIWQSRRMGRRELYEAISREVGWNYHTAKTRTIEEARAAYRAAQKLTHNDRVEGRDACGASLSHAGLAGNTTETMMNGYGCVKPDTDKQVFFYEQDFYVLSNFSAFTLQWKGKRFDTSEAAYHWEKFPDEAEVRDMILDAPSAHEAFKIAESQKMFRRQDWDAVKVGIMRDILRAKAEQHEYVRRKLLATCDRELIEDSWRDDFWGWGPNRAGKNMLGKLWMEVRAELTANELSSPAAKQSGGARG